MRKILSSLGLLALATANAFAQSGVVFVEGGSIVDKFGNNSRYKGFEYGGGGSVIIGGSSTKSSGGLVVIGGEARGGTNNNTSDMLGYMDVAIRIKNVSFGPGLNVGYLMRPFVTDSRCLTNPITPGTTKSSCVATGSPRYGTRYMGDLVAIGYSGFGKVTFGPQGKIFVQSRFIRYDKKLTYLQAKFSNGEPDDLPEVRYGYDLRTSVGYVFGKWFLRATYGYKRYDFEKKLANTSGIFNNNTNTATIGAGLIF